MTILINENVDDNDDIECIRIRRGGAMHGRGNGAVVDQEARLRSATCLLNTNLPKNYQNMQQQQQKTSPQAKRHKPSLLFTSLTIITFITR